MSDSVSAGVCHFQMNPRQTGRPVYEPQTHLLADLSSLCPAGTSICTCIMNHITTYRDLYNHRQTGRPIGTVMESLECSGQRTSSCTL